jgi:NAD(P)-dependent dehydrogenase (short-subunit alcohol dehydrogenase family)
MSTELTGQVAIVTGGVHGIGRAICETLAGEGAVLAIGDTDLDGAAETAQRIGDAGGQAFSLALDVAEEDQVKAFYAGVLKEAGRVDILVNNAGICRMIQILDIDVEEWDRMMAVNLRGTFLMSREAFSIMKKQRAGKIVSIASAAAKIGGLAAGAHYSASKAGVICFTKSLALQAAPYKIKVNAVSPGPAATEMTDAWGDDVNVGLVMD